MNVLFSWIGFKDLNFFDSQLGDPDFHRRLEDAKRTRPTVSKTSEYSPIFSVINRGKEVQKPFPMAVLLFDLDEPVLSNGVRKYLQRHCDRVEVVNIRVSPQDIHEYNGELWKSAIAELDKIRNALGRKIKPCFNLSSGTSAMKALLMLWSQTVYGDNAEFAQVDYTKGRANVDISPFDFNVGGYAVSETLRQTNQLALDSIKGKSPEIRKVKKLVEKAARTDFNVLIYGETGTGKELLARAIHEASDRREKQFRPVNCATLPPQLAESLLFGHTADAYTGAKKAATGWFEELDGGTIFLDEIEACPPEVQAKLLRALQPPEGSKITCRRFSPLGATKAEEEKESDVRIIAATNERLAETGFRSDLLNRLAALTIPIPPLRERRGDIKLLAEHILDKIRETLGEAFSQKHFDESAINFIESREWRGNVRELQNAITQAAVFGEGDVISENDFDRNMPEFSDSGASVPGEDPDMLDLSKPIDVKAVLVKHDLELKKRYVDAALEKTGGHKNRAAELLGVPYQTIDNWQKAWKKLAAKEKP